MVDVPTDVFHLILDARRRGMAWDAVETMAKEPITRLNIARLVWARRVLGDVDKVRQLFNAWNTWISVYA